MEHFIKILGFVSQINNTVQGLVNSDGDWAYAVIFLVIFSGAAFIFAAPVLPSVSLIFLITSLSTEGLLNPILAYFVLVAAISMGDIAAYFLGSFTRNKIINAFGVPLIKAEHLEKTKAIYGKADFFTIVFARFTPVVGSLAQYAAGTINIEFNIFARRNVIAGVIWMTINFALGWLCTIIPVLGRNFVLMFMIMPIVSAIISVSYYIFKNFDVLNIIKRKRKNALYER
jgi:membrane-associated protein